MTQIKVNREKMMHHAAELGDSVLGMSPHTKKNNAMSYTQCNSMTNCQEALLDLVNYVDLFGKVVQEDAIRIKQIGEAYAAKDREVGQKMQLEVR
ncbi:DUF3130 family protein [Listeria booriae]|uniref:DUF3130 family protein n=1 Tax=Listeria booriae TaxID=1552123 RepID=A0A7X0XF89_9LIST|nr:DUF3130 family protein [Listeria booriae]MBC1334621.1 DUF3130 family protein [Listeria booriae]MBC1492957.1 DUF3130 family protein [Listeria booriae]